MVVTRAQLPHAAARLVRQAGGRGAALVAPGLAADVPQAADVVAVAAVVVVRVALGLAGVVLGLRLERAADVHRLGADRADAVGVDQVAAVDQARGGQVGVRTCAHAQGVRIGVVVDVAQAEVQDLALVIDRGPGTTRAVAAAVGQVAGQFAAEAAGGDGPVVVADAVGATEAAGHCIGVGDRGLGDEVVVLGAGQFFQAVGLLELAELHEVVGVAGQLVLQVGVQELVGLGVVAHHPFHVARALALEHQLGAAQLELAVLAVAGVAAIEVGHIVVEPVAVGLDQALERDFRTADHIDGHFSVSGRNEQRSRHGRSKKLAMQFHGRSLAGRWEDAAQAN